jgi:hypothetical protein
VEDTEGTNKKVQEGERMSPAVPVITRLTLDERGIAWLGTCVNGLDRKLYLEWAAGMPLPRTGLYGVYVHESHSTAPADLHWLESNQAGWR